MAMRGTTNMNKTEQSIAIENMGAVWSSHTDREYTSYGLHAPKEDSGNAIKFLGDAIYNAQINEAELEQLKVEISNEHE